MKLSEYPQDQKKILLYYEGIKSPEEPYAGTSAIVFNLAKKINGRCNEFHVELMGDFIQEAVVFQGVNIKPKPEQRESAHALSNYDVVIFASHINQFRFCEKSAGQIWLLYQHCWKIEPRELSLIHKFDGVICLSAKHKEKVVRQGVHPDIVDVFSNAIDTTFFRPIKTVERKAHSIVYAGAIVPYKGLDLLLGAFNRILLKYPDATLDIYGNAKMWNVGDEYEQELVHLNSSRAMYHGVVPNSCMPEIYSRHSILCLPSVIESFSLVSIEAQACGCVPVAHDTGGVSVTVQSAQTGFLYSPNTAESLAAAIQLAFRKIDADSTIRKRCRQYICDTYDLDQNINEFLGLLHRYVSMGASIVAQSAGCKQKPLLIPQCQSFEHDQEKIKYSNKEHKMHLEEKVHQGISCLMDRGETDVAKWMLDKFLIDYPGNASGHYEKAVLAHASGDSDTAGVHFKKAAELEPDNPLFLKILGDFCNVALKNSEEAIRLYEQVLSLQPDDLDTLLTAAHLCVSLKRFDQAKGFYEKVLENNPGHMEALEILDKLNAKNLFKGQTTSAETLYHTAFQQAQEGNKKAAVATLEQLLSTDPENAYAHNDIGVLYYEMGEKNRAFDHYHKAVSLMPDNMIFQKNLADFIWVEQGDAETAMNIYTKVLNTDQKDVEALLGFAKICFETGRADDAKDFVDCALSVEPKNRNAAYLLEQIGKADANDTTSVDINALYERAKSKTAAGDQNGAIDDLNRLVQCSPECAVAYNDLGVLYYQIGDQEKALRAYEKSVQLDASDANAMKNLADFYLLEQQRVEEAMQLYLKALEQNPGDVESLLATGFVCTLLNKTDDAVTFYNRVIELDPFNRNASEALAKLQNPNHSTKVIGEAG